MFILSENLSIKYYEQISNSEIPKIDDSKIQLNNFIDAKEYIIFPRRSSTETYLIVQTKLDFH